MKYGIIAALLLSIPGVALGEDCNLKVVTDASPDYSDMPSLIYSMTSRWDTPAEKCWAYFYWAHRDLRDVNSMLIHGRELADPIRQFNDYGFALCSAIAGLNCRVWDAMGYKARFYDVTTHSISECFYEGGWHMYDVSRGGLYTLSDGRTIAGVEDIGKTMAGPETDGKEVPGYIAKYHCLTGTSANGFLQGSDDNRSLKSQGEMVYEPKFLKLRTYFNNWDAGHRFILNLREGENYVRYYKRLGEGKAFQVPSEQDNLAKADNRFHIVGNGVRTYTPALGDLSKCAMATTNVMSSSDGMMPQKAAEEGSAIFKVEGANVIASLQILANVTRRTDADAVAIAISTDNAMTWKEIWKSDKPAVHAAQTINLVDEVSGAYEVLVKVSLTGKAAATDAVLHDIAFQATTQCNSLALPKLNIGKNTVYVGAGEPTDSIVLWPDLNGDHYKALLHDQKNVKGSAAKGWLGSVAPDRALEESYIVYKVDAPTDISSFTYSGRLYNHAPGSHIEFLHSIDGGKTWKQDYSLTDTNAPYDVIHEEKVSNVPAGIKSILFKYAMTCGTKPGNESVSFDDKVSLYSVRMEVHHKPLVEAFEPLEVTWTWNEVQPDYSLLERSHTQSVDKLPFTYTINVGGADHPIVKSMRISAKGAIGDVKYGYSDGKDVGGEKHVGRWVTYGKNLAEGKPYVATVASDHHWNAGDANGNVLTDGVVAGPYGGGTTYKLGVLYLMGTTPEVTIDLGESKQVGAFYAQMSGFPAADALLGKVTDKVAVLVSNDGKEFVDAGTFNLNLRRKDIPVNQFINDEQRMESPNFILPLEKPLQARYVKFKFTPVRNSLAVSELQVWDTVKYEPFDLRIALPR